MQSVPIDPTESATRQVAASYERVSTRMQGQSGFSLGAQARDAAQFAADSGWHLPQHLRFRDGEDRHASGADWDLPGLNAMLDAAKRGDFQVLLVPTVDRFARDMTKALVLEQQLRRYNVRLVYLSTPVDDTAEGRLLLRQLQSFAEFEREKIASRTMRGKREKSERGMVIGNGPEPYGYRYTRAGDRNRIVGLEPDQTTAPVVKRMFVDALTISCREIVDRLRAEHVPPPRAPWSSAAVFRLLSSPLYAGHFVYGQRGRQRASAFADADETLTSVRVPPIVDRAIWDAVQMALRQRKTLRKRPGASEADQFVLRGLLTCAECGGSLSSAWNTGRRGKINTNRYYHCLRNEAHRARTLRKPVCSMRDIPAEKLEALVWELISCTLLEPDQLRAGLLAARAKHDDALAARHDRRDAIDRELARHRARLERIVDEMLDTPKGSESYTALAQRQTTTETAIRRLQAEQAEQAVAPAAGLSEEDALSLEQFATEVRDGIQKAAPADRRWVYERLCLTGTARLHPEGIQIGNAAPLRPRL
jgi:site-specific DNA recombinase